MITIIIITTYSIALGCDTAYYANELRKRTNCVLIKLLCLTTCVIKGITTMLYVAIAHRQQWNTDLIATHSINDTTREVSKTITI